MSHPQQQQRVAEAAVRNDQGEQQLTGVKPGEKQASRQAEGTEASSSESNCSSESSEEIVPFNSEEEAVAMRAVGLELFNKHNYEEALDVQYRIVRYFENKYGATYPECGIYFLDYGLSQLRMIQSASSMEAALDPLDHDALEACFTNLDVARVCFQKQERSRGENDVEVQLRLAEVHNAIAQVQVEREAYEEALKEYESELFIYRYLEQEIPASLPYGRLAAVLYEIADCYMKEGDFEGAEERFIKAIEEIEKFPEGKVDPKLVEQMRELLEDAREMKDGRFKEIQEFIQEQFAVNETERLPTAHEFYGDVDEQQHPFVSRLPNDGECSALSMPQSNTNPVQWSEHSNSMSLSLFPSQVNGRSSEASNSQPVQHVVARRKPKPLQKQKALEVESSGNVSTGSDMKRFRAES
ncbi:hypothetical protein, conserved [Trypanosoma brucei brucei TREU927]|uniref:Uncharacterized protein n=1 Tax=Trypanosoma brucei brucei (strain 927/4 GUTat10.1) TaxID=185431 RepID=Q383P9_TRYB2|nr:hypothetical protein, conserved [Trypanosoma brucei brucei TREU927]EAN79982.1 hypothetical protein, conserved [Trypanosoma brucei brucei TREU927]